MNYPDLKKFAQEAEALRDLPTVSVDVHPLGAVALISLVQLAIRHPGVSHHGWGKIAVKVARNLQEKFFNRDSEIYKVLEYGWGPAPESVPSDQV